MPRFFLFSQRFIDNFLTCFYASAFIFHNLTWPLFFYCRVPLSLSLKKVFLQCIKCAFNKWRNMQINVVLFYLLLILIFFIVSNSIQIQSLCYVKNNTYMRIWTVIKYGTKSQLPINAKQMMRNWLITIHDAILISTCEALSTIDSYVYLSLWLLEPANRTNSYQTLQPNVSQIVKLL